MEICIMSWIFIIYQNSQRSIVESSLSLFPYFTHHKVLWNWRKLRQLFECKKKEKRKIKDFVSRPYLSLLNGKTIKNISFAFVSLSERRRCCYYICANMAFKIPSSDNEQKHFIYYLLTFFSHSSLARSRFENNPFRILYFISPLFLLPLCLLQYRAEEINGDDLNVM